MKVTKAAVYLSFTDEELVAARENFTAAVGMTPEECHDLMAAAVAELTEEP